MSRLTYRGLGELAGDMDVAVGDLSRRWLDTRLTQEHRDWAQGMAQKLADLRNEFAKRAEDDEAEQVALALIDEEPAKRQRLSAPITTGNPAPKQAPAFDLQLKVPEQVPLSNKNPPLCPPINLAPFSPRPTIKFGNVG